MNNEQMEFPKTFEKFAKVYGFKDNKEVYTNGSDLITIFRVKQWLEHDNKLRKIETDTAYECGKHAGGIDFAKWVASEIFDDNWEYNKDTFGELACRKLAKLGIVKADEDEWVLAESEE